MTENGNTEWFKICKEVGLQLPYIQLLCIFSSHLLNLDSDMCTVMRKAELGDDNRSFKIGGRNIFGMLMTLCSQMKMPYRE